MQAAEFIRQRARMCKTRDCSVCPLYHACDDREAENPEKYVQMVKDWAAENPEHLAGQRPTLTRFERRMVEIYTEKGYLWAARDKGGQLRLYKRCPARQGEVFANPSPAVHSSRTVLGNLFPAITWGNSPVCLSKLRERK